MNLTITFKGAMVVDSAMAKIVGSYVVLAFDEEKKHLLIKRNKICHCCFFVGRDGLVVSSVYFLRAIKYDFFRLRTRKFIGEAHGLDGVIVDLLECYKGEELRR